MLLFLLFCILYFKTTQPGFFWTKFLQPVVKVPMEQKLSPCSYKIYPFKHRISKFEIAEVKIADFVSAQSWAILPSKMVFESRGQNAR